MELAGPGKDAVERLVERTLRDRGAMCAFRAFTRAISGVVVNNNDLHV